MGTRGLYGFAIDGDVKVTYNHWDSYPSGLGQDMLGFARNVADWDVLAKQVRALRMVSEEDQPSAEDIERLRHLANLNVASQAEDDWYCLLREAQGNPGLTVESGVMIEGREFAADSLFCEWGYVIDLDARTFEVYQGFQESAHADGRFATIASHNGYFPIRLIATYPLADLPLELDEEALTKAAT